MSDTPEEPQERRDFLARAAFWTTAGALGFAALGVARMPKPGVLPGQSAAVKIGPPGEYPVSAEPVRVPGQNLFVLHDADGFAAVAAVCTHLGCIVSVSPDGFECTCHGSRFARVGHVVRGASTYSLVGIGLSLVLDRSTVGGHNT